MSVSIVGGNTYVLNSTLTFTLTAATINGVGASSDTIILRGKYGSRSASTSDIFSLFDNTSTDLQRAYIYFSTTSNVEIGVRTNKASSTTKVTGTYHVNFSSSPFTIPY